MCHRFLRFSFLYCYCSFVSLCPSLLRPFFSFFVVSRQVTRLHHVRPPRRHRHFYGMHCLTLPIPSVEFSFIFVHSLLFVFILYPHSCFCFLFFRFLVLTRHGILPHACTPAPQASSRAAGRFRGRPPLPTGIHSEPNVSYAHDARQGETGESQGQAGDAVITFHSSDSL